MGLIWRPGSCRSYEWCSRLPRVKSRGRREAAWGSPPERAASAPGQTRGRCLWPPPGDFERTPRSGTEGAGWERTRGGQSAGPTANSCSPSFPLLFILASFLPSFQSVELLSRQVRSRSRSRGWLRKTSVSLKGVLLAVMLAEGRSLSRRGVGGWVCAPGIRTSQLEVAGEGRERCAWGPFRAEFLRVRGGCPPRFFQLSASASAPGAPLGVESQVRTRGGGRAAGGS